MPKREMLINFVAGEECRIAILEDGRLEELYQERASAESHVGNIYKGKVVNVEPAIQAAFIEFGLERNGFLHISDLHPKYFPGDQKEETEMVGQKTPRRERPPIQRCLRRGQDILVQVLKEGIGTKGPTLTSYLSVPGRFLVMMPDMERLGVSRKVEDDETRRELRQIIQELHPPEGFGFIGRTAAIGHTKTEIKRDLAYLLRLWKAIDQRMKSANGVGELYTESDLVIRTIRDIYAPDIARIIVDDPEAARRARDFLAIASPRSESRVLLYHDAVPLFHRFDVERQIETISARIVDLPSGGSLVFDQTEALVAIDVNSGKFRDHRDAETTAYKIDLEAADEICRQLRLRDLGGVIVNDLIDLRDARHRRDVEQRFRANLKRDRRTRISPISQFGVLEMTRQRMRPSLTKSTYMPCAYCQGAGHVRSPETVVLDVMRRLALALHRSQVARVELTVSPDVAFQLLNRKRGQLVDLEHRHGKPVTVRVSAGGTVDFIELSCFDSRGGMVDITMPESLGEPALEAFEATTAPGSEAEGEWDEEEEAGVEPDTGQKPGVAEMLLEGQVVPIERAAQPMAPLPAAEAIAEPLLVPPALAAPRPPAPSGLAQHVKLQPIPPVAPPIAGEAPPAGLGSEPGSAGTGRRRRRRRGRRGRGRNSGSAEGVSTIAAAGGLPIAAPAPPPMRAPPPMPILAPSAAAARPTPGQPPPSSTHLPPVAATEGAPKRRRHRGGRRHRRGRGGNASGSASGSDPTPGGNPPPMGQRPPHGSPAAAPNASRGYHNPHSPPDQSASSRS